MALQDRQLGQTKFELVINVKTLALASWLRLFAIADEVINGGGRGCLLSAQSGHPDALNQCPLSGAKRKFGGLVAMSAYDPPNGNFAVSESNLVVELSLTKKW